MATPTTPGPAALAAMTALAKTAASEAIGRRRPHDAAAILQAPRVLDAFLSAVEEEHENRRADDEERERAIASASAAMRAGIEAVTSAITKMPSDARLDAALQAIASVRRVIDHTELSDSLRGVPDEERARRLEIRCTTLAAEIAAFERKDPERTRSIRGCLIDQLLRPVQR